MQYLAEKYAKFMPQDLHGRYNVLEWLNWQVAGQGPMMGQLSHFTNYAPQLTDTDISYSFERYKNEAHRLMGIIETRLEGREFLAGNYSIADMAAFSWALAYPFFGHSMGEFPRAQKWMDTIRARPAVEKGLAVMKDTPISDPELSDETKAKLFGQK